jgi:hypothetical protein
VPWLSLIGCETVGNDELLNGIFELRDLTVGRRSVGIVHFRRPIPFEALVRTAAQQ